MLDWKAVSKGVNWCEMGSEVGEVAGGACLEFGLTLRALGSWKRRDLLRGEWEVSSCPDSPIWGSLPPGLNVSGAKHTEWGFSLEASFLGPSRGAFSWGTPFKV